MKYLTPPGTLSRPINIQQSQVPKYPRYLEHQPPHFHFGTVVAAFYIFRAPYFQSQVSYSGIEAPTLRVFVLDSIARRPDGKSFGTCLRWVWETQYHIWVGSVYETKSRRLLCF